MLTLLLERKVFTWISKQVHNVSAIKELVLRTIVTYGGSNTLSSDHINFFCAYHI